MKHETRVPLTACPPVQASPFKTLAGEPPVAPLVVQPTASVDSNFRGGFTLVEAVVSLVVVGVMMAAAMNLVGGARMTLARSTDRARGTQLAMDLMSEVLQKDYEEPNGTPAFGREADESASNRALYDDVDDYQGWNESPIKDRTGRAVESFTGWSRGVTVEPMKLGATSLTSSDASVADIKRITVTVKKGNLQVASLTAYRARSWVSTLPGGAGVEGNHAPVAVAWASDLRPTVNTAVAFDGAASTDPDGDAMAYHWDFGDGSTAASATASHAYSTAGQYTVNFTVTDSHGGVDTQSLVVSVTLVDLNLVVN